MRRKNDIYKIEKLRGLASKFKIEASINLDRAMEAEKWLEEVRTGFAKQKVELETVSA